MDAASVLNSRRTNCEGYDDLMAAMLRYLNIPARVEFGWVSAAPLKLPGPGHMRTSVGWSIPKTAGELHTWLEVSFPASGWVALDPQLEKFFVDTRHVGFFTNADAGPIVALNGISWYGQVSGDVPDGQNLTGAPLPGGGTESVPGDGVSSKVSIQSRDSFHISFHGLARDVKGVLLFRR
jgi:hypothetical protein